MSESSHLEAMIVKAGIIAESTIREAQARRLESGKSIATVLEEMGAISEDALIEALAKHYGLRTVKNLSTYSFPPELLALIPRDFAEKHAVFPLKSKDGMLATAVTDPFDREALDGIAAKSGLKPVPILARRDEILATISARYPKEGTSGGKEKILVVDDSQSITKIIEGALQKEGYEVVVGYDGIEGMRLALTEKPDLIICDTVMPRMDGYGLLRALKGNPATAHIPMILLTAKSGTEDEQRALEAGFLDFISKPVQPVRVISRVKRAFGLMQSMKKP
jgi:CheY-like chemotaxis protein